MGIKLDSLPFDLQKKVVAELAKQAKPIQSPVKKPKRNKYGAVKTEVDGITFDSKGEAQRYLELKRMEELDIIRSLKLQVKYDLDVGDKRLGYYVADFVYWRCISGQWQKTIEDFKGVRTPLYRWKAKHLRAQYGITILETSRKKKA
jgi:hypothetical protein